MPSPVVNTDGVLDHDPLSGRKSSSPRLRGTGSLSGESAFRNHPQLSVLGHSSQSVGLKSGNPRENVFDMQPRNGSGEFLQESVAKRSSNSREMLIDTFDMDVLNLPSTFSAQAGGLLEPSRHATHMNNKNGYLYTNKRQSSPGFLESETTDAAQKNVGNIGLTASDGYEPAKPVQRKMFQHKPAQPEVLGRNAQEGLDQDKTNSKSDVLGRQIRQWNLSSTNNSAALGGKGSSDYMDTFNQPEPGMVLNQAQRYQPPRSAMQVQQETQGRINDANNLPADTQGQYMLNGNAVQMMLDNNLAAEYGNTNVNSAKTHFHQMYKLSSAYQEQPSQDLLQDVIGGEKKAVPPPMTHSPAFQTAGGRQEVVYVNSRGEQGMFSSSSSSVDPDPSVSRLNSDKLCPVCNNDYSQVSMEDFQTHVFECFDDENPPETMKAHTSPERLCPMCSASFSYDMPQVEFERHVHGHFGEENPAEPFEILHP